MGEDNYSEVTSRSWFSRIGGAFKGIVIGFVLMAMAGGLLFWNEGRAVERYKTLKEGGGMVQTVSFDTVDPANEGRLVHVPGRVDTESTLFDHELGVQVQAISLIRDVEMYQWQESSRSETKKQFGGGEETVTTFSYAKEWSKRVANSANFKKPAGHTNPTQMTYDSKTFIADDVHLGAFRLPISLVEKIDNASPLTLGAEVKSPEGTQLKIFRNNDGFYIGVDPNVAHIGDLRVHYRVILPADVTLVARQTGASFEPYKTSTGGSIELLQMGIHTAETMFQQAQQTNTVMTWILRAVGALLMALGVNMILAPLVVLASIVPAIGSFTGAGTKLISMLVSGVFSLITISIAWFFYRPLFGGTLIMIALGIVILLCIKFKKNKPEKLPPTLA